ncbi:hypothetical protein COS54_01385 [Candidatus Shapirobacteria bacterium CG03_land_8_20_14_0_80_39_12]|uniref:Nucleotidyl transferase AbiEii/AbiGii toxin family protein n=1 Tax=Candidatus Shapirobacteria bacterium CG03_land_8_20_14_0_80_39_12 TaxID=1974879 RepID=A0A2M7BDP7_9BACT|nr:MAG: hypothetical protein COS54_01385 [Candidatus Shapirobacteria bacterium CG03_land_8_20_14_0_80_39_12]
MNLNVLNKTQVNILNNLGFLKEKSFYLAGGTALALQLGHRTSVDFDFYISKSFSSQDLLQDFNKEFKEVVVRQAVADTLILTVGNIDLSFFYYPYILLKPTVRLNVIDLASIEDISAMKIAAVVQRGVRRDFIDIYYLLQKFSLKEIVKFTLKKYPGYQEMLVLRALIYFKDADSENLARKIEVLDKSFSWEKVKDKIFEEVKKYQLNLIKK